MCSLHTRMHIGSLITATAKKAPVNEMMGGKYLLQIPIWEEVTNDEMIDTDLTRSKENLIVINLVNEKYERFFNQDGVRRFFNKLEH
jgi:hypothetical protein